MFPKRIHYLTGRLPEANYKKLQTIKINKDKYLQTLSGGTAYQQQKKERDISPSFASNVHTKKSKLPSIKSSKKSYQIKRDKSPYRLKKQYDDRKMMERSILSR